MIRVKLVYYRPKSNVFTSVCQEFCPQGGVYPSMHWGRPPGQTHKPPLPGQTPPWTDTPDGPCSGRYASYWNAFLFLPVVALYPPQAFRSTTGNTKGNMLIIRSTSVLVLAENAHLETARKRYSQFKNPSTALHIANSPFHEDRK